MYCIHNFINDACMGTCMVEFSVGNMAAFIISCIEVSMGRVFCPYKGFGLCQHRLGPAIIRKKKLQRKLHVKYCI